MHIHILGICGTFMGGIAALAREAGHRVTGSDRQAWPPMSTQLESLGIEILAEDDPAQLELGADEYIVGNVMSRGRPVIEALLNNGLRFRSGPEWLAQNLLANRWVIAVAGTHGKTTTSSLLAWILEHAGLAPGFLIGGIPGNFGISARFGKTPFFVVEADEYDSAFFDKRAKFVHYHPRTLVMNNLEFDHADIYPNLAAIKIQFQHLVRTVPGNGLIVVNGDDGNLAEVLAAGCWTPVEMFGGTGEWQAAHDVAGRSLSIMYKGLPQGRCRWLMGGAHNVANALAAVAAAHHAGVPVPQCLAALDSFRGISRRLELRGTVGDISVYDDFAHHPTAIAATLTGLRESLPGQRILAVVEPRSNTMRLGIHKKELADSLSLADCVWVLRPPDMNWDLGKALTPLGHRARVFADVDAIADSVVAEAQPGDLIVVMSNGAFGGIHRKIIDALDGPGRA